MAGKWCTVLVMVMALCLVSTATTQDGWHTAHPTFYGDIHGTETMKGACGCGDLHEQGYGLETTALSTALFNEGLTCGACYEIQCHNTTHWCINNTIHVTATIFCPPNYANLMEIGATLLCHTLIYHKHVHCSIQAGIVPIIYRQVPCIKSRGIKFEIKGNPYGISVLVYNVGEDSDVTDVKTKGSSTDCIQMMRNLGQNWQTSAQLVGESLSFQVTTSEGQMVQSDNVAPSDRQFGHDTNNKNASMSSE